ncbi:MAG: glucokinase [Candidatus Methylomirabilales bacterium]
MRAFIAKGRFTELMRTIPVKVALTPRAPLLGAAHYACRLKADLGSPRRA